MYLYVDLSFETGWIWISWLKIVENFFSPLSSRAVPDLVHVLWPFTCRRRQHTGRTDCKPRLIFFFLQLGNQHQSIGVCLKEERTQQNGSHENLSYCFHNLFMLSGLPQAQSHIYHFHLLMEELLCTLRFVALKARQYLIHNGQFKSRGNLMARGPGLSNEPEAVSPKNNAD